MFTPTKAGTVLLRPNHGYAFVEVSADLLRDAIQEWQLQAVYVGAGIDTPGAMCKLLAVWLTACGGIDDAFQSTAPTRTNDDDDDDDDGVS